jgi:putative AlgH/UPF0301 family transcriptional regulator
MQSMNLTNHFLIAMPAMDDPYFSRSLIYIAEHNDQGALGLIVNRPIEHQSGGTVREDRRAARGARCRPSCPSFWRPGTD